MKTGIAASGGVLGGYSGNKASKAASAYLPNTEPATKTAIDVISGS